jgi:hypothetical protein
VGAGAGAAVAAATRLLLGLGIVGGIWVFTVGDAAAGPLDGVQPPLPEVPKVTLPVTTPKLPAVGSVTEPLPLPAPVDDAVQTVTAPVDALLAPPPPAATVAPPPPPAAVAPAPAAPAPIASAPPPAAVVAAIPAVDVATVTGAASTGAPPSSTTGASVDRGTLEAPTGFRAVLRAARSSTGLFVLAGAAALFLLVQGRLDRRSPRLADAPIDRRAEMLEFS